MHSIKSLEYQVFDIRKNNSTDTERTREKAQGQIAVIRIKCIAYMERIK